MNSKLIISEIEKNRILNLHVLKGYKTYSDDSSLISEEDSYIEKVKNVQRALISKKYDIGSSKDNGVYSQNTIKAVKKFQKDNNLVSDGIVGPCTGEALGVVPLYNPTGVCKTSKSTQKKSKIISKNNFCPTLSFNSKNITDINKIFNYYKNLLTTDNISKGNFRGISDSNVWEFINTKLDDFAKKYYNIIERERISCQIALNVIRLLDRTQNIIIVDTKEQLIFLFDPNGKFIAKDYIISGKNVQSTDPVKIAQALLSWDQKAKDAGFEYKTGIGYVDITGQNRKYDDKYVYALTDSRNTRFTPAGIYDTSEPSSEEGYAGKKDNVVHLMKGNKIQTQAIHGYAITPSRTNAMNAAEKLLSDPKNPKVTQNFINSINKSINLDQSYGCINVTEEMLNILKKYWENAKVFVIYDEGENYLVDNPEDFFDKMINTNECPSPNSFGGISAADFA